LPNMDRRSKFSQRRHNAYSSRANIDICWCRLMPPYSPTTSNFSTAPASSPFSIFFMRHGKYGYKFEQKLSKYTFI
jgi:hypothetical protein